MADDVKTKIAELLLESLPTLLVVLGGAIAVLGVSTGIHDWVFIKELWERIAALCLGVILIGVGIWKWNSSNKPPRSGAIDLKITDNPKKGSMQQKVTLSGTLKRSRIPAGFDLYVIKLYSTGWAPLASIIARNDDTWESRDCNLGGMSQETIRVSVYLVGGGGKALIEYFQDATSWHRTTVINAGFFSKGKEKYLPTIKTFPPDMVECATTYFVRA